jgi:hypothetical protein
LSIFRILEEILIPSTRARRFCSARESHDCGARHRLAREPLETMSARDDFEFSGILRFVEIIEQFVTIAQPSVNWTIVVKTPTISKSYFDRLHRHGIGIEGGFNRGI